LNIGSRRHVVIATLSFIPNCSALQHNLHNNPWRKWYHCVSAKWIG